MVDEQEVRKDTYEMMRNAEGTAMFVASIYNHCNLTKEQARAFFDYAFANHKRQIELNPFATQEEKKALIQNKEYLMWHMKWLLGL